MRDLVPEHDETVRLIHIDGSLEIGDKRNFGCERADGDVIAHWDDDDYSDPSRLADQLHRLEQANKAVTGYHSMRFTDGTGWWKYEGLRNYSLGTSLCYRKEFWKANKFPSLRVGEDNHFVGAAWSKGQLVTADAGEMMYATIHPGNSSPRRMSSNWTPIRLAA